MYAHNVQVCNVLRHVLKIKHFTQSWDDINMIVLLYKPIKKRYIFYVK